MNMTATSTSKPDWLPLPPALLIYVIVPLLLLALPLALFRVTVGPGASLVLSLYFWSATVMVGWLAGALGSAILYRLGAPLRPPLWVITLFGPLLIGLALREPIVEILSLTNSLHAGASFRGPPTPMSFSWAFFEKFLLNLAPGTITWMATNYVFDRILDIPRYRYPAAVPDAGAEDAGAGNHAGEPQLGDPVPPARLPPLLGRLPRAERGELVALKSDDHYVRVYTDVGEALTLARLSDAIEMAKPTRGMQVHRSSWVADRAVRGFRRTGHTGILYLSNGLEVPVSRSYCRHVEGWVNALSDATPVTPALAGRRLA